MHEPPVQSDYHALFGNYRLESNPKAEGGFLSVGGTSISAPVFAGICAQLLQKNPKALQNISMPEYLYFLAGKTQYDFPQYYFNDITVGSNGVYDALEGYDLATGLGAPIAEQIIQGRR